MGWTVRGLDRGEGEIFCTCPDWTCGPPSLLHDGYWVSFPGLKWLGHGVLPTHISLYYQGNGCDYRWTRLMFVEHWILAQFCGWFSGFINIGRWFKCALNEHRAQFSTGLCSTTCHSSVFDICLPKCIQYQTSSTWYWRNYRPGFVTDVECGNV